MSATKPAGRWRFWAVQAAVGGGYRMVTGTCDADALPPHEDLHHPDMRNIIGAKIAEAIEIKPIPHERDAVAPKAKK